MVKLVILIHLIALMLDQCHRFQMLQEGVTFGAIGLNFSILKLKVFFFLVCLYSMRLPRRIELNPIRDLDANVGLKF